jgi:hypothetical protein
MNSSIRNIVHTPESAISLPVNEVVGWPDSSYPSKLP